MSTFPDVKMDWVQTDPLEISIRSVETIEERILSLKKKEDDLYRAMISGLWIPETRPSFLQVLKKVFFSKKEDSRLFTSSSSIEMNREQMIAIRDWIDEMLYDPANSISEQ